MNSHNQSKTTTALFIAFVLACFGFLPKAQGTDLGGVLPGNNTADGSSVLISRTTGLNNSGFGFEALKLDTTGSYNTATGIRALLSNVGGSYNTANGAFTLSKNTSGLNTATGFQAMYNNTTGGSNTADGYQALFHNTSGQLNIAVGFQALYTNNGDGNTAVGESALRSNTTGTSNTALGSAAGFNVTTASNVIAIGNSGANVSDSCFIGNVYNTTTARATTSPVIVSDSGQLGTVASSQRFKKDIVTMDKASEAILSLRPVTFHYKTDTKGVPQFGLIAEEVEKVNPGLVLPDKEGKPFSVRYDAVNAMLLNEFLKEHKKVEELTTKLENQNAIIAQQQKGIEVLAAQIQKVSDQMELSKAMPQVAVKQQ